MQKNRMKQSFTDSVFDWINVALLALLMLIIIVPLWFVVVASVSNPNEVIRGNVLLWPKGFTVEGYKVVFAHRSIMRSYGNTIFYTLTGTALNLFMTILCAYPLSRKDLKFRSVFTVFFSFTMLFSGGMIPTYLVVNQLGLINTLWSMILPGAISVWNMLIMKNFFQTSIPESLQEAAAIDGASDVTTLVRIVLPLSMPILAVMVLYYGVGHWNSYFGALIYLTKEELFPLQLVLRNLLNSHSFDANQLNSSFMMDSSAFISMQLLGESMKYAAIIVSSVPVLMLYPLLQKYFVKGVMLGAIKG